MVFVPICPALFLWVSGFVGAILPNKSNADLGKRTLGLALLSSLLMVIEYGWQGGLTILAPGILTIFAVLSVGMYLLKRTHFPSYWALLILLFGVLVQENFTGLLPLTWGYLPWLPDLLFGFFGFFVGRVWLFSSVYNNRVKSVAAAIAGSLGCGLIALNWGVSAWIGSVSREEFRIELDSTMAPWNDVGNMNLYAWNLSLVGFWAYASVVMLIAGITALFEPWLRTLPDGIWWSSRNALKWYVGHLVYWTVLLLIGFGGASLLTFGLWCLPLLGLMIFGSYKNGKACRIR